MVLEVRVVVATVVLLQLLLSPAVPGKKRLLSVPHAAVILAERFVAVAVHTLV